MKKMLCVLVGLISLVPIACCDTRRPMSKGNAMRPNPTIESFAPKDADIVQKLSDTMLYFKVRVGGKHRKFILITEFSNGSGQRQLLELRDEE